MPYCAMAKSRRPGQPPVLRGTLGTLLRTTLQQVGMMRDVVERQARSSRSRLDGALLQRKHRDMMLALGEAVYELAVAGELGDLEEFPEITQCLVELEELEAQIAEAAERAHREAAGITTRPRAIRRTRPGRDDDPPRPAARESARGAARDDSFRVWRPTLPDDPLDDPLEDHAAEPAPAKPVERKPQRKAARSERVSRRATRPSGGGGIAFVDDDPLSDDDAELAEYMHADDVPAEHESKSRRANPESKGAAKDPGK